LFCPSLRRRRVRVDLIINKSLCISLLRRKKRIIIWIPGQARDDKVGCGMTKWVWRNHGIPAFAGMKGEGAG